MFVPLDNRAQIASELTADLLISIHADALDVKKLGEKNVQEVRGGTIYTLSETASDEQAKILAQEENKADLKAGVGSERPLSATVKAEINSILNELEIRGKKNRSLALANYLIAHMKDKMKFNIRPQRSANLRRAEGGGRSGGTHRTWIFKQHRGRKVVNLAGVARQDGRGARRRRERFHGGAASAYTVVARFGASPIPGRQEAPCAIPVPPL